MCNLNGINNYIWYNMQYISGLWGEIDERNNNKKLQQYWFSEYRGGRKSIKYGINGTGKTTIARAIEYAIYDKNN